jgi:hypothetical protein
MVTADRTGRSGNEAGDYGERWRVGLHFIQPNLAGPLSKSHSGLGQNYSITDNAVHVRVEAQLKDKVGSVDVGDSSDYAFFTGG